MKDIHSCSYYCNRPECVLVQRNELRDKLAQLAEPEPEPVACFIGAKGSAFDLPTTKRAYTYAEQPGNVVASRLGLACNAAASQSAGDSIDRGLGLLQELQKQGFGVFDLGAEYVAPPTRRPLTPVQEAAPDMLEALDKIACFAPGYGDACEIIAKVARAAIAKTTGGNDE
jgi:hypothetical protein